MAIEAADVVLMSGSLQGTNPIALSRVYHQKYSTKFIFGHFYYNVALVQLPQGFCIGHFDICVAPIFAAGAMVLSSVFVLGNPLRLKYFQVPAIKA